MIQALTCGIFCIGNKGGGEKPRRKGKTSSQQSHFTNKKTEAQRLHYLPVNWESWDWKSGLIRPESTLLTTTLPASQLADGGWPAGDRQKVCRGCVRKGTGAGHEGLQKQTLLSKR